MVDDEFQKKILREKNRRDSESNCIKRMKEILKKRGRINEQENIFKVLRDCCKTEYSNMLGLNFISNILRRAEALVLRNLTVLEQLLKIIFNFVYNYHAAKPLEKSIACQKFRNIENSDFRKLIVLERWR